MEVKNIIKIGNLENQLEMLQKMDGLAVKSAEGIYSCTTSQKAMLEKLDALAGELAGLKPLLERMDELAVKSADGTYNATINMRLADMGQQLDEIHEAAVTKK